MEVKENPESESHGRNEIFNVVKIETTDYELENRPQVAAELHEFKEEKFKNSGNFHVSSDNIEEVRAEDMFVTVNDLVTIKEEIDDVQQAVDLTDEFKSESNDLSYSVNPSSSSLDDQTLWSPEKQDGTSNKFYQCPVCNTLLRYTSRSSERKCEMCQFCGKYFHGKLAFLSHQLIHTQNIQQSDEVLVEPHVDQKELSEEKTKCDNCLEQFPEWELKDHVVNCNIFKCEVCLVKFKDRNIFDKHVSVNTVQNVYKCAKCCKDFTLQCHKFTKCSMENTPPKNKTQDENPLKSQQNTKQFPFTMRTKNTKLLYSCDICQKQFESIATLKGHELYHSHKMYKCTICSKEWKQTLDFREHFCYIVKHKVYTCEIYSKEFKEQHNLNSPLDSDMTDQKPYKCGVCMEKFINKQKLLYHIRDHTYKYKCGICLKRFLVKRLLLSHIQNHSKRQLSQCMYCPKQFPSKASLSKHVACTHATPCRESYKCDKCSRDFLLKSSFLYHNCKKSNKCLICLKQFPSKADLNHHSQSHEKTNEFSCPFCSRTFSFKKSLFSHIDFKHTDLVIS